MNLKEIKEMIALMNENNLTELELEREGLKIRLRRGLTETASSGSILIERGNIREQNSGHIQQSQVLPETVTPAQTASKNIVEIKAPMVGTFYRAPSPDAAPFIDIGSNVEIGQVICIIEAMKLMNEIKSEIKGKIREILVDNADPIEFGQVLLKIETA
ncbi:MAG: acetyl-CoA carboxylase biotin carboxyl carrier protein [Candidatus Omnitrophica bacterium]|nr:acetyl-CoA carboxylase biotin carboxyl carrier protein [Candidatus Omnitrophota bacterium]